METYAKFMKELLTKKWKFTKEDTRELEASCSVIIQKYLFLKSKDLDSITIQLP